MHIAPLSWYSEVAGYRYDRHVACSELYRAYCIAQIPKQCHGPTLLLALFDTRTLKFASSASVSISSASTKSRREFQPRQAAWMVVLLCSLASSFCSGLMLESGFGDAGTRRSGCGAGYRGGAYSRFSAGTPTSGIVRRTSALAETPDRRFASVRVSSAS